MTEPIPAVGYIRVSTAREEMISPELQQRGLAELVRLAESAAHTIPLRRIDVAPRDQELQVNVAALCRRCGHGRHAHEHYRAATDCAVCDCPIYRRAPSWRCAASVPLRIAGCIAGFAVLITAGAYAVHGLILLIRAIP